MEKYLLILGANSDIANAIAHKFAQEGYNLYLASRDTEKLKVNAKDIEVRYNVKVKYFYFDALNYSSHKQFYQNLPLKPEGVVCAFGYLGDQKKAQTDFKEVKQIINTNFTGCVSILNIIANDFEQRKRGFIIGISSVAGDRGRKSNYIYGSAKAGFTVYLSGLRNRLSKAGVQVITVKPGFVQTKMTQNMKLPKILTAKPQEVAEDIYKAMKKRKDVVYTKWMWQYIMLIIKLIPEKIFKKMSL